MSPSWIIAAGMRTNTLHAFPFVRRADGADVQLALLDEYAFEQTSGPDAVTQWLEHIRAQSGAQSVRVVSNYGRAALTLDVATDYDKRRAVLDAALQHLPDDSLSLTLQNRLGCSFTRGMTVTNETMERQFIAMCDKYRGDPTMVALLDTISGDGRPAVHEGMWCTDEMRANIRRLVAARKIPAYKVDPGDVWEFGDVVDTRLDWPHVPSSAQLNSVPAARVVPVVSASECMICLDKAPSTIVLPCEHVVVCTPCSIQLRNTPDRAICVQCRRPISDVLEQ